MFSGQSVCRKVPEMSHVTTCVLFITSSDMRPLIHNWKLLENSIHLWIYIPFDVNYWHNLLLEFIGKGREQMVRGEKTREEKMKEDRDKQKERDPGTGKEMEKRIRKTKRTRKRNRREGGGKQKRVRRRVVGIF